MNASRGGECTHGLLLEELDDIWGTQIRGQRAENVGALSKRAHLRDKPLEMHQTLSDPLSFGPKSGSLVDGGSNPSRNGISQLAQARAGWHETGDSHLCLLNQARLRGEAPLERRLERRSHVTQDLSAMRDEVDDRVNVSRCC